MSDPTDFSRAEDQAIDWAILLADDPENKAQQEEFTLWLAASPLHREAWTRTQTVYAGLDKVHQLQSSQSPVVVTQPAPAKANVTQLIINRLHNIVRVKVIGGIAVSACLLVFALPHIKIALMADFHSGTNELQVHQLEDGSKIFLAPNTAVDIRFSDNIREVQLLKGNVFFEVQSNPARPFQVNTDTARVTVLGTAFDVDSLDNGTIVSVAHGRVQVDDKTSRSQPSQQLTAGDQLAISNTKNAERRQIMLDEVARWRERELVARNMPISKLVDAFRPYYNGIILVDDAFAHTQVTGLYRLDNPVATLSALAEAHGARARHISPWVLILSQ